MAGIGFDDGSGYMMVRGIFAAPLNRFRQFTPTVMPLGPQTTSLGTGRSAMWTYRTEYRVSLEMAYLSGRSAAGESSLRLAGRLIAHLMKGGAVDLAVEDDAATASLVSWLAEGTTPTIAMSSPQDMLYSFSATFANTTTPYVAIYGGVRP